MKISSKSFHIVAVLSLLSISNAAHPAEPKKPQLEALIYANDAPDLAPEEIINYNRVIGERNGLALSDFYTALNNYEKNPEQSQLEHAMALSILDDDSTVEEEASEEESEETLLDHALAMSLSGIETVEDVNARNEQNVAAEDAEKTQRLRYEFDRGNAPVLEAPRFMSSSSRILGNSLAASRTQTNALFNTQESQPPSEPFAGLSKNEKANLIAQMLHDDRELLITVKAEMRQLQSRSLTYRDVSAPASASSVASRESNYYPVVRSAREESSTQHTASNI